MSYSQKDVFELFTKVKSDLQRTEAVLSDSKTRVRDTGGDSTADTAQPASSNTITPQQATLHFQREAVETFKRIAGKMVSGHDNVSADGKLNIRETAASFIRDTIIRSSTSHDNTISAQEEVENNLKFRLTKGMTKALNIPIDLPEGTFVSCSSSNGGEVAEPNLTSSSRTIRQTVVANLIGGRSQTNNHFADTSDIFETDDDINNIYNKLRHLTSAELSSVAAQLWFRVFSRILRGLFFVDLYTCLLQVHEDNTKLSAAKTLRIILTSTSCANQLKGIHDALYLETTSEHKNVSRVAYQADLFRQLIEGSYWNILEETLQVADDSYVEASESWSEWYSQVLTVRNLHPLLLSMMLMGSRGKKVDMGGSASIARYRSQVLSPMVQAATTIFASVLSTELPLNHRTSFRSNRQAKDDFALIAGATHMYIDTCVKILCAHLTHNPLDINDGKDSELSVPVAHAEAHLRQELVVPLVAALKESLELHRNRIKMFGLSRDILRALGENSELKENTDNAETHNVVDDKILAHCLPSRRVFEMLYQPLKQQLRPLLTALNVSEYQGGTVCTLLYQILSVISVLSDDEEKILSINATKATSFAYEDDVPRNTHSGIVVATHDEVRAAIRKAFERRSHLIDRSAHDGVGGGQNSGGIVYKWNRDVFVAVCGELGLNLTNTGRRPLELGGQDLFQVAIPSQGSELGVIKEKTYQVYVDKGLLFCRPLESNKAVAHNSQQQVKALGGSNGSLLLKAPKAKGMIGTASAKTCSGDQTPLSFTIVEKFEAFFSGEELK